jgi:subtilisin family serine protease
MHFYSVSKEKIQLEEVPTDIVVQNGVPFVHASLPLATASLAGAARSLFSIGLEAAGRAGWEASRAGARATRKKKPPPTCFRDRKTGLVRMVYKEAVIRVRPGTSERRLTQILKKHGYQIRTRNSRVKPELGQQYVVFHPHPKKAGAAVLTAANDWATMDEVIFATPNFVSQYHRAQGPAPNQEQWHLRNTANWAGQVNGEDVGALEAWKLTDGDPSITVAVVDDGIDVEHPNLKPNIRQNPDPAEPQDVCGRDFYIPDDQADHFNPRPKNFNYPYDQMGGNDIHGTACAGVVAAAGVNGGAVGVAPGCKILPVKVWHADKLAADERVADAIRYAALHADVVSCSWFGSYSSDVEMALHDSKDLGRNGKGAVLVFASGNAASGVAFPARNAEAMAVGASTDKALFASYSNQGPEQCVVAPSSGGVRNIFTTDVSLANRGFNPGDPNLGGADGLHTNTFGGTSSAAPLVAGVAALMLSVKPMLDRDAVREILQSTAQKIGKGYNAKGRSDKFGYGRVDAAAAVAEAKKRA